MAARGLVIRVDVASAPELRRRAKKEPRRRTAQRMLAIANALDGMSRADAARAAGIKRPALRDAEPRVGQQDDARPQSQLPGRRARAHQVLELRLVVGAQRDWGS